MAIASTDIKLLASARMVNADDGGGPMTGSGLQDGVKNNVFPDLSSTDRAFGKLDLMKFWPAVLSNNTDVLLGAHLIIDDQPDDAYVQSFAMLGTSATESRADAVARLQQSHWEPQGGGQLQWATAPYARQRLRAIGGTTPVVVGMVVYAVMETGDPQPVLLTGVTEILGGDGTFSTGFASMSGGDRVYSVTFDGTISGAQASSLAGVLGVPSTTSPRIVSTRPVSGTLAIGDTYCTVDTLLAQIVPKALGSLPGDPGQIMIDGGAVLPAGVAAAFRGGDGLVIHHTAALAAASYANGNTVNMGRTGLASVRLIGADGRSISTGWTVNLSTGVATVVDITGWSQPVVWRHTIEEVLACERTWLPEVRGGSTGSTTSIATAPFVLSIGLTMFCGRSNVGRLQVISKDGLDITGAVINGFAAFAKDLVAGTVTFNSLIGQSAAQAAFITSHSPVTLVSSGSYTAPRTPSAPQSTPGRITFNRPLTKAFPAGTLISSMLLLGDLQARVGAAFSQQAWTSVWADARIGDAIGAQYQQLLNPIAVSNRGAVTERWALIFLTSTTFKVVGEALGQIATGDVNTNLAPVNPAASGAPYFTLAAVGWGLGWAAGNVLRFNTFGANGPVWGGRCTLPSTPDSTPDSVTFAARGDQNA